MIGTGAMADRRGRDAKVTIAPDARGVLVVVANGDARVALNALELAADAATADAGGIRHVDLAAGGDALQRPALVHHRPGDCHYDTPPALNHTPPPPAPHPALHPPPPASP